MTEDLVRVTVVVRLDQLDFLDARARRYRCSRSAAARQSLTLAMTADRREAEIAQMEADRG